MSTGRFCWFDLMSTDVLAAGAFYHGLFGWDVRAHNPTYAVIHDRHGRMLGGLMAASPGGSSGWLTYVTTDALDDTIARIGAGGGTILRRHRQAGVGELAVFQDPRGATLATVQLAFERPYPRDKSEPHIGWSELHSDALDADAAFYVGVFGWAEQRSGDHVLVGDQHAGSLRPRESGVPAGWIPYVNVWQLDPCILRAEAIGATVLVPPRDLAGVGRYTFFRDPVGACIAVMETAPGS